MTVMAGRMAAGRQQELRARIWSTGVESQLGITWASEISKPAPRDTLPPAKTYLQVLFKQFY